MVEESFNKNVSEKISELHSMSQGFATSQSLATDIERFKVVAHIVVDLFNTQELTKLVSQTFFTKLAYFFDLGFLLSFFAHV